MKSRVKSEGLPWPWPKEQKEENMFETSFFKPQKNYKRKAVGAPLSLATHVVLGLLVIVIPLLRPGELPKVEVYNALLAPPPLPAAPPLPPAARKGSKRAARIKPVQAQSQAEAGRLVTPIEIPNGITDEALTSSEFGDPNGVIGGVPDGLLGGVVGSVLEKVVGRPEEPVIAQGQMRPPKLFKKVAPIYPEIAREAHIEGPVVIEATTDIYGRVVSWKVLHSIPLLDQAALDAVRQWIYEPLIINGKPRGVIFTVTVRFQLKSS